MKAYQLRTVDNTAASFCSGEILRAFAQRRPQLRPTEPGARNPLGLRRRREADLLEHGQQQQDEAGVTPAPFVAWLVIAAITAAVITFAAL